MGDSLKREEEKKKKQRTKGLCVCFINPNNQEMVFLLNKTNFIKIKIIELFHSTE